MDTDPRRPTRDWVAVVLAIGIATAVNAITFGVLWDAIVNPGDAGLSENATQILTAAFGGITGILGGYIGYKAGSSESSTPPPAAGPPAPPTEGTTHEHHDPGPARDPAHRPGPAEGPGSASEP